MYCFCCGTNVYCSPITYGSLICYKVYILLLYQVSCVPLVSYINMHIPIVFCCGAKRVLFLPRSYQNVGVISLNPTCLPSFMYSSLQIRELHKHACPILMYGPKLFIVVF